MKVVRAELPVGESGGEAVGFGMEAHGDRTDLDPTGLDGNRKREGAEVSAGAEHATRSAEGQRAVGPRVVLQDDEREARDEEERGGEWHEVQGKEVTGV